MSESWLRNEQRLEIREFSKQDKVFVWRSGKGTKTKPGWGGKWLGPGVVLVHERSIEGPGKIVWVALAGKLYRAAPEHLRLATEREGIVFDLNHPRISPD